MFVFFQIYSYPLVMILNQSVSRPLVLIGAPILVLRAHRIDSSATVVRPARSGEDAVSITRLCANREEGTGHCRD